MNIDREKIIQVLTKSASFHYLNKEEIIHLSEICSYENYNADEIIFSELQPAHSFYVIEKGNVNLIFDSKQIIQVSKGQIFGDWAVLNETVRLATSKALNQVLAVAIDAKKFKNQQILDANVSFKIVLELAKGLVTRLQSKSQISSRILIDDGETEFVEFKSTLRKNLMSGKKDPAIEMAVIKTIAGFLNNNGGVLFIGVKDNKEILGIQEDEFLNEDKMLLHLSHLITSKMGSLAFNDIHCTIVPIQNKNIIRIDCTPTNTPIFISDNTNDYFFVRSGVQTVSYNIKNAVAYIKSRF
ncbi:MAG: putative DNA binding domain-containing protein [Lutibacter sp.]|nr:putative DNA binding domain-containing protein [Lutibacter sp.]MDT8416307.1 putative DNA binding domain-containing protein [Lutibacter sp.]